MNVNGITKKNIKLEANTPRIVEFGDGITQLSIVNMGDAEVYFKLDDQAFDTLYDDEANYLNEIVRAVDIEKTVAFYTVTFVASFSTTVQWDYKDIPVEAE